MIHVDPGDISVEPPRIGYEVRIYDKGSQVEGRAIGGSGFIEVSIGSLEQQAQREGEHNPSSSPRDSRCRKIKEEKVEKSWKITFTRTDGKLDCAYRTTLKACVQYRGLLTRRRKATDFQFFKRVPRDPVEDKGRLISSAWEEVFVEKG